ncbi:REP-associated tyrosine transposase [Synoicihabitans lomoniglobus]|uniref:Transposase n=1 Tax=Synoicihabitans lomoniglobus TaxID=2909285 RepID=A0AAE9ZV91_9BACT|nr:transposase [Opitutaceae bacterium LMO-M01]WED64016.1 transposase [Opitutaceae bacterium LMO-M01]
MSESPQRGPGYGALRRGRIDLPGATYFLTMTVRRPLRFRSGLMETDVCRSLQKGAHDLVKEDAWWLHAIVIMPDHVHMLVRLTSGTLAAAVRAWKGRQSTPLRKRNLSWQPGFYDHRLRPQDQVLGVVRYMWLNPYRADLVADDQVWPGWWCSEQVSIWLGQNAADDRDVLPPAWWR